MTMRANQKTADTNADEASGSCPVCGRHGLRVFLLRQAVIFKNKTDDAPNGDYIYQELGEYAQKLNFANRMPSEALNEYFYILRTVRNGYIYVMQQNGDDVDSRIIQVYESIDNSLRLKNVYSVAGTKPRELPKACRDLCHSIPAAFIHLDEKKYTQAWVGYSSRPWSTETIDSYLTEKDDTILSRFTKVDLLTFAKDQVTATKNRSVPFKDIFGNPVADDISNKKSKVLEFRFPQAPLSNFESVHAFHSCQNNRQKYGFHVWDLYDMVDQSKTKSAAIVLEDTFAIAEELNAQRANKLFYFNNQPESDESVETKLNELTELTLNFNSLREELNKGYEDRANLTLSMINPYLKQRFQYYADPMLKKRIILQLIQNWRSGLENSFDQKLNKLIAEQENAEQKKLEQSRMYAAYNVMPISTSINYYDSNAAARSTILAKRKTALDNFDKHLNQKKIDDFVQEAESAYNEVLKYFKQYSDDYYIYIRWLFGDVAFKSAFSDVKPTAVNQVKFWLREFDFTNEQSQLNNIKDITNILLDVTGSDITLDEDNAFWDEILSNPASIYYVLSYANSEGIPINEQNFTDVDSSSLINWRDVLIKGANFGIAYNQYQNDRSENTLTEKEKALQHNQQQINANIKSLETKIADNDQKIDQLQKDAPNNQAQLKKLRAIKKEQKSELKQLNEQLHSVENEIKSMLPKESGLKLTTVDNAMQYLFDQSVKKNTNLLKQGKHQPINLKVHRLHIMCELTKFNVYSAEIKISVRTKSIETIFAMLAEMQGEFFRHNGFSVDEQAFLKQFYTEEKPTTAGGKKPVTKECKLLISFPDEKALSMFLAFIKGKTILSVHDLNKFIKTNLAAYKLKTILNDLIQNMVNEQKIALNKVSTELSDANLKKGKPAELKNENKQTTTKIIEQSNELDIIKNKSKTESIVKNLKQSRSNLQLNFKINTLVGLLTLWSVQDNFDMWGKTQPGDREMTNRTSLFINLSSLALLGVDLASQFKDIKLQFELLKATRAGISTELLESRIVLNGMISKGVGVIFSIMLLKEALTELASTFNMRKMDTNRELYLRIGGSVSLGFGAIFILITNPIFIAIGVILLIAGAFFISLSHEYDNWSPIDHWLNRCYFGKPEQLDYFGYTTYQEDTSMLGFGQAINDYLIAANQITIFVSFRPSVSDSSGDLYAPMWSRNVQLYLDIPNFVLTNKNGKIKLYLRLFDVDGFRDTVNYIDLVYTLTSEGIYREPTIVILDKIGEHISKYDGTDYVITNQSSPENGQYKKIIGLIIPKGEQHPQNEFNLTVDTLPNSDEIIASELEIKKHIAETFNFDRIKKYQLIAFYYNQDKTPLIIHNQSNNIASD